MKICYIANYVEIPYRGGKGSGGATHVYEVAKGLVERGHVVYLLCGIGSGQAKGQDIDGISVKRVFKSPGKLYYTLKHNVLVWLLLKWPYHIFKHFFESIILVSFLLQNKCELICERSSLGTKIHSLIYLMFDIPLVLEINDYQDRISNSVARFIITPNKSVIFPRSRHKVVELPWGANTKFFQPDLQVSELRHKYVARETKIVLIVCCGAPWHGLDELIAAANIVSSKRSDIVFMVVGGGDHFLEYKEKVDSLGLTKEFIFTGMVDYAKVPAFISIADITVAPYNSKLSREDKRELFASPLKVFEYMACAKPVIITDVANKNNIIEHMQTGVVVKTDSPDDIARAILDLSNNETLCFKLGVKARKEVEKRFSWQSHVRELEKIFLSLQ